MVRYKTNKGFTLTEVITTLVILGVVLTIAIPGFSKLYQKFVENYYKELDESVLQAAKLYFKDEEATRPTDILEYKTVSINDGSNSLLAKKYIDKAKLFNNEKDCTGEVRVLKVKDNYIYKNCMICQNNAGDVEYRTYENLKAVEYDGVGNIKPISSDNICYLNNVVEKEYSDEDLFVYINEFNVDSLKQALEIKEKASISKDGEKIYEIETGDILYPENITGINLNNETVTSGINSGIEVKYSDVISRNVYVYKYRKPELTSSATGNIIYSPIYSNSDLKLYPNSGTFKINNTIKSYPYINVGVEAIGNPLDFSPDDKKEFSHYEYTSDGITWNKLCENNMSCIFNVSALSVTDKRVKFRTVGKDINDNKYYSEETAYYDIITAFTVTFNPDGGVVPYNTKSVYYGGEYGQLPTPTNGTREFKGWYTDAGVEIDASSIVEIQSDHTLTAKWGPQTYLVTLNPNGGSVSPSTKTVLNGENYGDLPIPTRSSYVFTGWYTAASGGILVESTTKVTQTSNHTLYAQWYSSAVQTITKTSCPTKTLPAGVYYIEIVGGGAGGLGKEGKRGGNAARWAGFVNLSADTYKLCVGSYSSGSHGVVGMFGGGPDNGGDTYISNSGAEKLITAMGGKSYVNKPFENAITKFKVNTKKLECNNVSGKWCSGYSGLCYTKTSGPCSGKTASNKYGLGGDIETRCGDSNGAAYRGTSGIIKYQYVSTLQEWDVSPKSCPVTPLCSVSDCGWVNWP